jgi:hypothetical protein
MSPWAVIRMDDARAGAQPGSTVAGTVGFPVLFVVLVELVELAKSTTSTIHADTLSVAKTAAFTTNSI